MANTKVTFKKITIGRLVSLHDDVDRPTVAYEFGNGLSIFQKAQEPGKPYGENRFIREKDIDPSLR